MEQIIIKPRINLLSTRPTTAPVQSAAIPQIVIRPAIYIAPPIPRAAPPPPPAPTSSTSSAPSATTGTRKRKAPALPRDDPDGWFTHVSFALAPTADDNVTALLEVAETWAAEVSAAAAAAVAAAERRRRGGAFDGAAASH